MAEVTVVGGGLAGMVAALRLLERGCQVSIFEESTRVGGKAGANWDGQHYNDHGYHLFPAWYLNMWRLVDDLKIRDHFVDVSELGHMLPGDYPKVRTLKNVGSLSSLWTNLTSGILPIPEMLLTFYSAIDLMTVRLRYRAFLDQITMTGFLHSKWYATERIALVFQDLILKGISVPTYRVSAMTMRIMMKYWVRYPLPVVRLLRGDLQNYLIEPLRGRLQTLGCKIYMNKCITRVEVQEGVVTRLHFRDTMDGTTSEVPVERVVMAVPPERLVQLVDDRLYQAAPNLAQVKYLNSIPMAALNIYLKHRIAGLPKALVNLVDSKFALSLVDVSQTWDGLNKTVLNVISSDFATLEGLSEDLAMRLIVEEIGRYLPLSEQDIESMFFQPHTEQPLFMNDVGIWRYRPVAKTQLPNLYLTGDYCRTHVDLVSMEGALTAGLHAAEQVRRDLGISQAIEVLRPQVHPHILLFLIRAALFPFAMLARLATLLWPAT